MSKVSTTQLVFFNVSSVLSILTFFMVLFFFVGTIYAVVQVAEAFQAAIKFWNKVYERSSQAITNPEFFEEWRQKISELFKEEDGTFTTLSRSIGIVLAYIFILIRGF